MKMLKTYWSILFFAFAVTPVFAGEVADEVINRAMQTVVAIFPASPDDEAGGGSGVVVSPDGYAVTNFHVVQPCGPAMKCGMADGRLYDAVIVGLDPVGDIALIKLIIDNGKLEIEDTGANSEKKDSPNSQFPHSPLADSNSVAVGDTAVVMGNPFLLATDFKPCVSQGIISGIHRYQFPSGQFLEYTDCLQTDAAVNPGNSGGPLFNDRGEVIGIVGRCSFEKRGRVNVGIGYAVSSNQVRYFLGDLKSGRIVDHATMNAVVSTDREGRVLFDDVLGTSDAFRSGLRYNDELLRFAGRTVDTANTFKNLIGIFPKNWRLPVTVRGKEGERFDLAVRLGSLHSEAELIEMTEKMIEPPIVPPDFERMKKGEKIPPGYKEIELPGPDGKPVKVLKKEHFIPETIKPFYQKERGYANFHFNKVERDRVLKNWRKNFALPNQASKQAAWKFVGKLKDRPETFSFQIDDKGVRYELPIESGFWDAGLMKQDKIAVPDPLMHYQAPRGSGGLFTALYLLRQLALNDTWNDAEINYLGTAPIGGNLNQLNDVCTVSWLGNDVRFYFDPVSGAVAQLEMFGSGLDFPCEILFYDKTLEVRYGRIFFGTFELSERTPDLPFAEIPVSTNQTVSANRTSPVLAEALTKVVKIYGAGTGSIHAYQSGILVSPDGYILTALTSALQADPIHVVLDNGRRFDAVLVAADPVMELAMLKIPAAELPCFELQKLQRDGGYSPRLFDFGDPIYAISNPFNIAEGNEAATVQRGIIAARTSLRARRGVFETPYKGEIYVVDMTTNNPGSCGGALISTETGELLGILGKELRNNENNSWLNYVIPTAVFQDFVCRSAEGTEQPKTLFSAADTAKKELIPEDTIRIFQNWGILLVSPVGQRTPPFIDSIRPESEAAKLGLLPDDLIVMINNRLTPSLSALEQEIHQAKPEEPITLTIERDMQLRDVTLRLSEPHTK